MLGSWGAGGGGGAMLGTPGVAWRAIGGAREEGGAGRA
jgi:hypothetical protein